MIQDGVATHAHIVNIILVFVVVVEMPFGISPVLEVDGTKIGGGENILRYLGLKFGKNTIVVMIIYPMFAFSIGHLHGSMGINKS